MRKKSKSRASRSVTTGNTTMARRKRRSFGRRFVRSARKSGSNANLMTVVGASMLYGAGRAKLSALTQQYLPAFAGQYTDEVVLGLAGWYLSKKGGMIGALGRSALIIESASIGNQLASGFMSPSSTSGNSYSA